jgi:hypothetical protein
MAQNKDCERFEVQQIAEIERIFRKMNKLLDALPDQPEHAELIGARLKVLQQRLHVVEMAKPPN